MKYRLLICCALLTSIVRIVAFDGFGHRLRSTAIHEVRGQLRSASHTDNSNVDALNQPSTSVIVTGANGVLGRSFVRVLSEDLPLAKVHPTYRDRGRLDVANTQLNYDSVPNIMPLIMDMNNIKSDLLSTFREIVTDTSLRKLILINNAGVCLEGNTRNILQESLDVNCLSPVSISELLIEEFSNPIRVMNGDQLILINISSGDGELTYLHTDLAKNISGIKTFMEWMDYIRNIKEDFDPNFEYSYGPTPLYSLSKALLNSYTKIKGDEYEKLPCNISIFSVCPGNVASPMSTAEELCDTISPVIAVKNILELIYDPDLYENGKFYRNSINLPW